MKSQRLGHPIFWKPAGLQREISATKIHSVFRDYRNPKNIHRKSLFFADFFTIIGGWPPQQPVTSAAEKGRDEDPAWRAAQLTGSWFLCHVLSYQIFREPFESGSSALFYYRAVHLPAKRFAWSLPQGSLASTTGRVLFLSNRKLMLLSCNRLSELVPPRSAKAVGTLFACKRRCTHDPRFLKGFYAVARDGSFYLRRYFAVHHGLFFEDQSPLSRCRWYWYFEDEP